MGERDGTIRCIKIASGERRASIATRRSRVQRAHAMRDEARVAALRVMYAEGALLVSLDFAKRPQVRDVGLQERRPFR